MLLLFLFDAVFLGSCQTSPKKEGSRLPATLILAIDGVGFATFKKAQTAGLFTSFRKPARMISLFPTVSDPNWNAIFNLERSLGFTKNTFDPRTNNGAGEIRGSILSHISDHPEYEKRFDHSIRSLVGSATNMAWLETGLEIWLADLPLRLLETRGRSTFFAFTLNVDLISHTQGEESVIRWLGKVDKTLTEIQALYLSRGQQPPEVVLISDHGNSFYPEVQLIDIESHAQSKGWNRGDSLKGTKSFVFVAPEILSVAGFWSLRKSELASDIAVSKGVLFAAFRVSDTEIQVHSRLLKDSGFLLKKSDTREKPQLRALLLESTLNQTRLFEAFEIAASEPPDVLAVAEMGWAFSNPFLKVVTDFKGLKSLHGAMFEPESEGIFVSNRRDLPDIRPWDFSRHVDLTEFQRRH